MKLFLRLYGHLSLVILAVILASIALVSIFKDPNRSSVSIALATIALCFITAWYGWLTYRLVSLGQKQMATLQRSEHQEQWRDVTFLANLAERVGAAVRELPESAKESGFDIKMRGGVLWQVEDLWRLERLSVQVGPWAYGPLVDVVNYLNWMNKRMEEIRSTDSRQGYNYRLFPGEKWAHARQQSDQQLTLIARLARNKAEQISSSIMPISDTRSEIPSSLQ